LINVLVTGAGGGVGQGIIKSLKMITDMDINIVAADMCEKATGLYAGDISYLVDRCDSGDYLVSLAKIFKEQSICYYFPGTDVELKFCAENKRLIKDEYGVHTVISSLETVSIADDKYKTFQFLKDNGFSHPKTILATELDFDKVEFPLIVKPSVGCRSIGVYKASSKRELEEFTKAPFGLVVQELVGNENTEFTCTVVKVDEEISPVVALKRVLRSGDTYRAEPIKSEVIENYVRDVASKLEIDGSCNFQLRLDSEGVPKIFEINSRFSGTTPFCAQIGFNPVEFYLKKKSGIEYSFNIDYESVVLRYWAEVVVKKSHLEELKINRSVEPVLVPQFNFFD